MHSRWVHCITLMIGLCFASMMKFFEDMKRWPSFKATSKETSGNVQDSTGPRS